MDFTNISILLLEAVEYLCPVSYSGLWRTQLMRPSQTAERN